MIGPLVLASLDVSYPNSIIRSSDDEGCGVGSSHYVFENIYYWVRIGSILFNVVLFVAITIKLQLMGIYKSAIHDVTVQQHKNKIANNTTAETQKTGAELDNPSAAIHALVQRLKYYPFIQTILRMY